MSARGDLVRAVRDTFRLVRHDMSEEPASRAQHVGFVHLPGATQLKAAIWRDGEWRSDKGKPFPVAPLCWFSIEIRT